MRWALGCRDLSTTGCKVDEAGWKREACMCNDDNAVARKAIPQKLVKPEVVFSSDPQAGAAKVLYFFQ